jgi:hypothetical protein
MRWSLRVQAVVRTESKGRRWAHLSRGPGEWTRDPRLRRCCPICLWKPAPHGNGELAVSRDDRLGGRLMLATTLPAIGRVETGSLVEPDPQQGVRPVSASPGGASEFVLACRVAQALPCSQPQGRVFWRAASGKLTAAAEAKACEISLTGIPVSVWRVNRQLDVEVLRCVDKRYPSSAAPDINNCEVRCPGKGEGGGQRDHQRPQRLLDIRRRRSFRF